MSHQFKPGETGAPLLDHGHPAFPDGTGCGTGMTLREYASIKLRVPESGTPWLDEMIRKANRRELAGKALVGVTQGWFNNPGSTSACVEIANDLADALLARIGGAK